jgi:hypothetical protein
LPNDDENDRKVEVLDPLPPDSSDGSGGVLALIANYTDRPDLLLEVVEKHDPGFIKRMNHNAEIGAAEFRKSRFNFGRVQAYATLIVSVISAVAVLGLLYKALLLGTLSFWTIIAFAVFYAVAQGGRLGFLEVAKGVKDLLGRKGKDEPKD